MRTLLAIALLLGLGLGAALAQPRSDSAREQRWAEQILPSLVIGEPVWLATPAGGKFLALWAPVAKARGLVLLAHGPGLHPDHGITGELRMHLTDRGYATLSLQMPVLPAEQEAGDGYRELMPDAAARIAAGMRFLQEKGPGRIAIVSHAMGSGMTHEYLRRNPGAPVSAWAALSYYGVFDAVKGVQFPVLDLFGENDYRGIRGPARDRARLLAALPGSRQLALPEGGRFLAGGEKAVLREVGEFLDTVLARGR